MRTPPLRDSIAYIKEVVYDFNLIVHRKSLLRKIRKEAKNY